jgi:hypothetical protein
LAFEIGEVATWGGLAIVDATWVLFTNYWFLVSGLIVTIK